MSAPPSADRLPALLGEIEALLAASTPGQPGASTDTDVLTVRMAELERLVDARADHPRARRSRSYGVAPTESLPGRPASPPRTAYSTTPKGPAAPAFWNGRAGTQLAR